jgi:hypothetical protein
MRSDMFYIILDWFLGSSSPSDAPDMSAPSLVHSTSQIGSICLSPSSSTLRGLFSVFMGLSDGGNGLWESSGMLLMSVLFVHYLCDWHCLHQVSHLQPHEALGLLSLNVGQLLVEQGQLLLRDLLLIPCNHVETYPQPLLKEHMTAMRSCHRGVNPPHLLCVVRRDGLTPLVGDIRSLIKDKLLNATKWV